MAYLDSDTGVWKPPLRVLNATSLRWVSIDVLPSTNEIALSFTEDSNIFMARFEMQDEKADQSTLTQVVSIPEDLQSPTLSFFYQVDSQQSLSDRASLSIQSETESLSFRLEPTTGWRHRWLDMSQWAGETLTITFNVSQTVDGFATWAYVDEVTLGSASPDLWISGCDTIVVPGDQIVCSLQYGNQGSLAAENAQIVLTLPGSLVFVDAAPAPDLHTMLHEWHWNLGTLPVGSAFDMVITTTVAFSSTLFEPLIGELNILSSTPEFDTQNNQAFIIARVGSRVYLPLVKRVY
jgi:hypothetical protein